MEFKIGNINIGQNHKPLVIAEMSGNHNQSLERALKIVEAAALAGAHVLKLQTYTADTMTMDVNKKDFQIDEDSSLWKGQSLYSLFEKAHTPWDWHKPIMDKAKSLNMLCFSTPFDESAVDFLEDLNVPAYKIGSFENTHIPLIKKVARTGKPVIISTGMASIAEIDHLVRILRSESCNEFALLKCTSTYPASAKNSNILTIPNMRDLFNCEVGLSDHTMGIGTSIAAVSHGATIVEKHFTTSRADGGVDSEFSMEPDEMKLLVRESFKAWESLGGISYGSTKDELDSTRYRRSIYVAIDIKKGHILKLEDLKIIRPGSGLEPKLIDVVVGLKVNEDIAKGTPLQWSFFK